MSTGEKLDALTPFHPDRLARRILGMGDVLSLVEKAQQQYDEQQAESLRKKLRTQSFDLNDFYDQIQKIKKMGSVADLLSMIPGAQKALQGKEIDDSAFKKTEAIILSMTPDERSKPELLNGTRRKRIALGSGASVQEVNELVKQFDQMKKMMKTMSKMGNTGRGLQSLLGGSPIGR